MNKKYVIEYNPELKFLEYAVYTYKEKGGKENTDKFLELVKKEGDENGRFCC